jgi:hypothetical protein
MCPKNVHDQVISTPTPARPPRDNPSPGANPPELRRQCGWMACGISSPKRVCATGKGISVCSQKKHALPTTPPPDHAGFNGRIPTLSNSGSTSGEWNSALRQLITIPGILAFPGSLKVIRSTRPQKLAVVWKQFRSILTSQRSQVRKRQADSQLKIVFNGPRRSGSRSNATVISFVSIAEQR